MDRKTFVLDITTTVLDRLKTGDTEIGRYKSGDLITSVIREVIERSCVNVEDTAELWLEMSGKEPRSAERLDPSAPMLSSMKTAIFEATLSIENMPIYEYAFEIFYRDNEFLNAEARQRVLTLHRYGHGHSWSAYLAERLISSVA